MHESWKAALGAEFEKGYFRSLVDFVRRERANETVYPPPGDVFQAFSLTPLDQIRVVILGQDPYPGAGQAHGLAFSVRPGVLLPPSLVNIYRELREDVGFSPPGHGCLEAWARQGVLLLNSILTVRAREPGSHAGVGWEEFTDAVVRAVANGPRRVVFLLWGQYAEEKGARIDPNRHRVIISPHPSPKSADRGFFGSRPFSRANAALLQFGENEVGWGLSNPQ